MKSYLYLVLIFICLSASAQKNKDLMRLSKWMCGEFNNAEQVKKDSSILFLHLSIKPIWENCKDACWFYVEQTLAKHPGAPYRQRVYRLTQNDNKEFENAVFTLKGDLGIYVGHPELVEKLHPDSLNANPGCSVYLKKEGKNCFKGSTRNQDCYSELRGARYASSDAVITKNGIMSWDRGYNKEGQQVWGPANTGSEFKKILKK